MLDTSGAGQAGRASPLTVGWARRAGPEDTLPDGLPDPDVMKFDFQLDPFQKQVQSQWYV